MTDIAIRVQDISKCHHIYDAPRDRLKQFVVPPLQRLVRQAPKQYFHEFWALKDVSFEIEQGEAVAIIGRNGSGKSTLLQMICGTLAATSGSVETNGRIAALLELGAGFNPEFSGRENVYLNGALLGLTKEAIDERFDDIAAFADIGQFIEQPIKTYSSGMAVRLAFSIQAQLDPDILIIDEALSVGDFFFQQKCFKHIRDLRDKGMTLLFVSHDMGTVRDLCARTIYLRSGKSIYVGDTDHALKLYYQQGELGKSNTLPPEVNTSLDAQSLIVADQATVDAFLENAQWATRDFSAPVTTVKIIAVKVVNSQNQLTFNCGIGEKLTFRVMLFVSANVPTHVALGIKNKQDQLVTCMGTYEANISEIKLDTSGYLICDFEITFNLEAGGYSIHFSAGMPGEGSTTQICYGQTPSIGPINITWDYQTEKAPFTGMMGLPVVCTLASPDSL